MKIKIAVVVFSLLPLSSHALTDGMAEALDEAKKEYTAYAAKSADEILEHEYDETDAKFLGQLDLADMYNTEPEAFEEPLEYRFQTVKDLAWAFQSDQLAALPEMIKKASKQFDQDRDAMTRNLRVVELALLFKKNKLNEDKLREALNSDVFKN